MIILYRSEGLFLMGLCFPRGGGWQGWAMPRFGSAAAVAATPGSHGSHRIHGSHGPHGADGSYMGPYSAHMGPYKAHGAHMAHGQVMYFRVIDIRVEFAGNMAFQKCACTSLVNFILKRLFQNRPNIKFQELHDNRKFGAEIRS